MRFLRECLQAADKCIAVPVSPSWVGSTHSEHVCGPADTHIGFAGNDAPSFVFPTAIASKSGAGGVSSGSGRPAVANKPSFLTGGAQGSNVAAKRGTEDLDYFIGDEALAAGNNPGYGIRYPVRHGQVENWDDMERFWSNSIFKYLRVEPEDHYFLLTEPVSMLQYETE